MEVGSNEAWSSLLGPIKQQKQIQNQKETEMGKKEEKVKSGVFGLKGSKGGWLTSGREKRRDFKKYVGVLYIREVSITDSFIMI